MDFADPGPADEPSIAALQAALEQRSKDVAHLNDFLSKREAFIREGMGVFTIFYQRALDTQEKDRLRFDAELANRQTVIAHLNDEVAKRDVLITRKDGESASREQEINRLHEELVRRDAMIARLEADRAARSSGLRLPFSRSLTLLWRRLSSR